MKTKFIDPPRTFMVKNLTISDMGEIWLEDDEMVSFVTKSGKRADFAAKSWGFYLTPSINGRLKKEGFKTCLVKNLEGQIYILAVEKEKREEFDLYLKEQSSSVLYWFDEFADI